MNLEMLADCMSYRQIGTALGNHRTRIRQSIRDQNANTVQATCIVYGFTLLAVGDAVNLINAWCATDKQILQLLAWAGC